jgi:hypothetical protein
MKDLSGSLGANTFSYMTLPNFFDTTNTFATGVDENNYNEQVNPVANAYYNAVNDLANGITSQYFWAGSDVPICSGIHGAGCHLVPGMDNRNQFRGPGSWHDNLGIVKDFKVHDRYAVQIKGEFINVFNHANTVLNLGGTNDVSLYTDVLAYKGGLGTNRNTELSVHLEF